MGAVKFWIQNNFHNAYIGPFSEMLNQLETNLV